MFLREQCDAIVTRMNVYLEYKLFVEKKRTSLTIPCCALQNENEDAAIDGGRTVADSSFGRVRRLWQSDR